jgi:hypothetical protein
MKTSFYKPFSTAKQVSISPNIPCVSIWLLTERQATHLGSVLETSPPIFWPSVCIRNPRRRTPRLCSSSRLERNYSPPPFVSTKASPPSLAGHPEYQVTTATLVFLWMSTIAFSVKKAFVEAALAPYSTWLVGTSTARSAQLLGSVCAILLAKSRRRFWNCLWVARKTI